MKLKIFLFTICFVSLAGVVDAQSSLRNWTSSVGGSGSEEFRSSETTADGGTIATGFLNSKDYAETGFKGSDDVLVARYKKSGTKLWAKVFGGTGNDYGTGVLQAADGSYIIVGNTSSTNGDVTGKHGETDAWVIKVDSTGTLIWKKCIGGNKADEALAIKATGDGNYIIAGSTFSDDGDAPGAIRGSSDAWLVKISPRGTIIWQQKYGGSEADIFRSVAATADGGFIACGTTKSNDYGVGGFLGKSNYWVLKTSSTGAIEWQKCYGGERYDSWAVKVLQLTDGGYFVAGNIIESGTGDRGQITSYSGRKDMWAIKINSLGNIQWQKTVGAYYDDECYNAIATEDGGFMMAGRSDGSNVIKLNSAGAQSWNTNVGLSNNTGVYSIAEKSCTDYVVTGFSNASIANLPDAWVAKYSYVPWWLYLTCTTSENSIIPAGGTASFKALTNGLANPIYQWTKNGINVGTNSETFTATNVQKGDKYAVNVTSTSFCSPSDKLTSSLETQLPDSLLGLSLNVGTLSPAFSSNISNYTTTVPSNISEVTLSASTNPNSILAINNVDVAKQTRITLKPGTNVISIQLKMEDGFVDKITSYDEYGDPVYETVTNYQIKQYTLTINRTTPNNADIKLGNLTVNKGTLYRKMVNPYSPGFSSTEYAYLLVLDARENNVIFTPVVSASTSSVKIDGQPATSGVQSLPVSLESGTSKDVFITVTAADGTVGTYVVTVQRDRNTYIKTIAISSPVVAVTEPTGINSANYTAVVPMNTTSINVTGVSEGKSIVGIFSGGIGLNGFDTVTTNVKLLSYITTIKVSVIASLTSRIYTLTVTKSGADNTSLSSIKINPAATLMKESSGTADRNYFTSVPAGTTSIQITPTAENMHAIIRVNGKITSTGTASASIPLNAVGSTVILMNVTSADGSKVSTYSITISKSASSNTALSSILLNPSSYLIKTSGTADRNYSYSVPAATTQVTVTPSAENVAATITVNGAPVASGTASGNILLGSGPTVITMVVTAPNTGVYSTYSLTVTRTGSVNANLAGLQLNNGELSPAFSSAVTAYTAFVSNSVTGIKLKPRAAHAGAVIRVKGVIVGANAYSGNVPLSVGLTTIPVLVTSENGTTKTYTLTVYRQVPSNIASINKNTMDFVANDVVKNQPVAEGPVKVHQAVSPNGDGVNDLLQVDGLQAYPENELKVMNRNGEVVYQAKNYGAGAKGFDGHDSKGQLQLPGTYFYLLEYTDGKSLKRLTGYLILKY